MKRSTLILALAGCACITSALITPASAQTSSPPRNDLPQPYRTTRDWGELPTGMKWAAVTSIEAAADGSIYVIQRCAANSCAGRSEPPILKYDQSGKLLKAFGSGMFIFPHGSALDPEGNLWVTDAGGRDGIGHQVIKFSPDGKELMGSARPACRAPVPTCSTSRTMSWWRRTATSSSPTATAAA
jgi:hypothetical protein